MSVDDPMVYRPDSSDDDDDSQGGNDHYQDDDARSDTSSEITELRPDEFPTYFQQRGNRLFHSHGRSPYPLPVDAAEQFRYDGQHVLLHKLIGEDFVGPVRELLRPLPGEQQHVLDLGTGTGRWVLDMAQRFPHVRFDGVDIVPIATRYPPSNVQFEIQDLAEPFRYRDGAIHFVHARNISMAVVNYPQLLQEVARVLRPSGLYLAGEWERYPSMDDDSNPALHAPHICAFFQTVLEALNRHGGVHPTAPRVEGWLRESGKFDDIQQQCFRVPIGGWPAIPVQKDVGRAFADTLKTYTQSVRMLLLDTGYGQVDIQRLIDGVLSEMDRVHGMYFTYYTVHARRTHRA